MNQKPGKKIYQQGIRIAIAQFVLRLLYGRKWHYISPWKHSAIVGVVVLMHNKKVLLGKRLGEIEQSGKISLIGGHIDPLLNESIAEGAAREVFEETCITIDPSKLTSDKLIHQTFIHNIDYIELQNGTRHSSFYIYNLSKKEIKNLKETEEAGELKFYTLKEIEELNNNNMLASKGCYVAIQNAFKTLK